MIESRPYLDACGSDGHRQGGALAWPAYHPRDPHRLLRARTSSQLATHHRNSDAENPFPSANAGAV